MKHLLFLAMLIVSITGAKAKTLIAYYSFTNNIATVVNNLQSQIDADVLRIEPAEEGLDYAADNYAIGSALIAAIRNNPNDAASYPAIKTSINNIAEYDRIIIATPLWWSNMAAPMQSFLFRYGSQMANKEIGLIVSSASSSISGVEADAKRLIPNGKFAGESLWVRSSQTSSSTAMISDWLSKIGFAGVASLDIKDELEVTKTSNSLIINGKYDTATLYRIKGSEILTTTDMEIETSSLSNGIYILRIVDGNNIICKKISL